MKSPLSRLLAVLAGIFLAAQSPAAEPMDAAAAGQAEALGQTGRNQGGSKNQHPDAQWFPGAGLGLFIHWGLASPAASGDLSWGMLANKPWRDQTITPNNYYAAVKNWDPSKMDFDKILGAAKAAGTTYAVFVTKHHDGFTLWPSAFGDIGTKYSFGGRDFVKEFTDACRKHGLKVGLYYSPPDWWFDREYRSFNYARKPAFDMDHQPVELKKAPADHAARRVALVRGQVTELLSNYGKVDLIWFDGGKGEIPNAEVRRLMPGIIINKRNGGAGDYGDSEVGLPGKRFSGWFETCATCWPSKKWAYTEDYGFDDARLVLTKLVLLRAWGGNLLANLGPKGDGTAPDQAYACWADMAKWMEHSGESVIGTSAGPWPGPVNVPVTTREGTAYLHFLPELPEIYPNTPADEKKFTGTRDVMPSLPTPTDTAVWQKAPKPAKVVLLRTGEEMPFTYENETLTVKMPENLRCKNVDVVKVEWANP